MSSDMLQEDETGAWPPSALMSGTLKGEAAVKFQSFMESQGVKRSVCTQLLVLEGLRSMGLVPPWYDLGKMMKGM